MIDVASIGAGGGSIARVDGRRLRIGPQSAAADPGPACYGQGGTEPTVSDADLVLGYLDPDHFLGGRMKLDRAAAEAAIRRVIADPLGIPVEEAAFGIHAIVNENMASAAKAYVSEKGESPRSCALVGFGGAGPVHSCDLAARLGIDTVLIPPRAGVAAAFGMIVAPVTYDAVRSRRTLFRDVTPDLLAEMREEMKAECGARLPKTVDPASVAYEFSADMRYLGQGYDVNAVVPEAASGKAAVAAIRESFERAYLKLYGRVYPQLPLEVMSFRLSASSSRNVAGAKAAERTGTSDGRIGERPAYCPRKRAWMPFAVHRRDRIGTGIEFDGPAIVEENESTTVIPSGARAHVDAHGSLIIKLAR
jgi:N-methylhydantoinase A